MNVIEYIYKKKKVCRIIKLRWIIFQFIYNFFYYYHICYIYNQLYNVQLFLLHVIFLCVFTIYTYLCYIWWLTGYKEWFISLCNTSPVWCVCPCVEFLPGRCVCTPHTDSHTRGSSPGTAHDKPSAALPPPLYCSPSPTEPCKKQMRAKISTLIKETKGGLQRNFACVKTQSTKCYTIRSITNLLVFGDGIQKLSVQFGVVLGQGLVAVVIDELHYRQEGKRLWEAVAPLSVVNLY